MVKAFTHEFGGVCIVAPYPWINTTDDVKADEVPFTLVKKGIGVGALQFSIAPYKGGEEPNITVTDLKKLLAEFADSKGLRKGFNEYVHEDRLSIVAASWSWGTDLLRIWYCSDERNVTFITYVCEWEKMGDEIKECEEIIKSLRFSEGESEACGSKR